MSTVGAGAVYDRGYRPYDGPRGGRSAARLALYKASIRRALGLRRSWRQKVAPFVLLAIATIPAVVNVGANYLARDTLAEGISFITYREYVGVSNFLLVFVALTAPDLMCPDRRQRVLPLYFARPLTGLDYVLAKVGAMSTILFFFGFLPQVVLFLGQMLVSEDGSLTYAGDHADVLWKVPLSVAAVSLFFSTIGLALSAFAKRRIAAAAMIVGLFLVTSIMSGILTWDEATGGSKTATPASLVNLWALPLVLRDLIFLGHVDREFALSGTPNGGVYAVALYLVCILAAAAALLIRYDEVER